MIFKCILFVLRSSFVPRVLLLYPEREIYYLSVLILFQAVLLFMGIASGEAEAASLARLGESYLPSTDFVDTKLPHKFT